MTWPAAIQQSLDAPPGARFLRCALQVNPYQYVLDNKKVTGFADEATYNDALVERLVSEGIEVICITDHFRIRESSSLRDAARAAGLIVLPGFEAVAKDGVHYLCIFDQTKADDAIERVIGACGVHGASASAVATLDSVELLEKGREWGAVFVAAHVVAAGGLLATLKGTARASVWRSEHLMACSLAGPVTGAPDAYRGILRNQDKAHSRDRMVAILNAQDICDPADVSRAGTSCWIKTSELTVEGLRQAFLDPGSRVRLGSEPAPTPHTELVAISWEGGFLDGVGFRLNENLNSLIGGRGSGKSTVVESIRYALGLEPIGDEAGKAHSGIVRNVLRDGTKLSLLVRSHTPTPQEYLIERTVPHAPNVRTEDGTILSITPRDVLANAEVYGQHEIAELARSPQKLTTLLHRFMVPDASRPERRRQLIARLRRSREALLSRAERVDEATAKLARLPALQERLKRYQAVGVEAKLKERSQVVTEQRILSSAEALIQQFGDLPGAIRADLPLALDFLSDSKLAQLPGRTTLKKLRPVLSALERALEKAAQDVDDAMLEAAGSASEVRKQWEVRQKQVQDAYDKILRELQATKIDAKDFVDLRTAIEDLVPVRDGLPALQAAVSEAEAARRQAVADWEDEKTAEFRELDRAANRVSRQLGGRVRVRVTYAGNREPLFELLRSEVGGRLSETIDLLRDARQLSAADFVNAWRTGSAELVRRYRLPVAQADRLVGAPLSALLRAEEAEMPHTTEIELNLSPEPGNPAWQRLEDLSTGQKATAVLLLLLLESDAPLIVDQPEDDLDNRFITESVVPKMRDEKRRRQFVFATHNANIPVLGDAELIVTLEAIGEASRGHATVRTANTGSIDNAAVRDLTEELLEGGRAAFEMRRMKYGF